MERIGLGVKNQTIAEHANQTKFVIKKFVWLPEVYSDPKSIISFGKTAISGHQKWKNNFLANFSCRSLNPNAYFFSNLNFICSNILDLRNLQGQDKIPFQILFCPFTVWINCSSDPKRFSRSLQQFFSHRRSKWYWEKNTNFYFPKKIPNEILNFGLLRKGWQNLCYDL